MDDEVSNAFVATIKGELLHMRQCIARIEDAIDGKVITRKHLEKLIGPQAMRQTKAKLDRDPEVREYVFDQIANHPGTMKEIAERTKDKFGAKRAPSASTINAYLRRLRKSGRL